MPIRFIDVRDTAGPALRTLTRNLSDLRPAWPGVTRIVAAEERALFSQPDGPPLAESTRRRKARLGQPQVPLVATGALKAAATIPGGPGQRVRTLRTSYRFSLDRGRFPALHIVAARRPVVRVRPRGERRIRDVLLDHLLQGTD